MKTAVVAFLDELSIANSLLSQVSAESGDNSCELWVLGGLRGDLQNNTFGFHKITEILMSVPENLSEPICCVEAICECYHNNPVDIIIFPSDARGNELAAGVSVLIDCEGMLGAKELSFSDGITYVKKPVYSHNLQATFLVQTLPLVISLTPAGGTKTPEVVENPELSQLEARTSIPTWLTNIEVESLEDDDFLKRSNVVLAAGRGVGKAENFSKLSALAQKMGGVLGGSRPTVCDGKMPPDRMIGMSAAVLSPDCCIVFGASGAAPFLAGVEGSKLLVAVNSDPNALIFDNCDVGIIADCNEFAEALSEQYKKHN